MRHNNNLTEFIPRRPTGFTLYPPRSRHDRIEFDDDGQRFSRGLHYAIPLSVLAWLIIFVVAWAVMAWTGWPFGGGSS